ncbi:MAG: citrate lyase subunit alpha [Marinifilaceae bacterium]
MKNSFGVEIPESIDGLGKLIPYTGAWALQDRLDTVKCVAVPAKARMPHFDKVCANLEEAIKKTKPFNGMCVSFHHHLRGGDQLIEQAIETLAKLGIKDICIASSSLTTAHDCLVPFIQDGTITKIFTSGIRGELGRIVTEGALPHPIVVHSHGGRARAIVEGRIAIDLAILGASAADNEGNATGQHGPSAFGSMGYGMMDAKYAKQTIIVTDNMVEFPCVPASIPAHNVDFVTEIECIGDAKKIAGGTTRITKAPLDLRIAKMAGEAIVATDYFKNGISFQVGAGGASLAVAKYVREAMIAKDIKGSFLLGGVTSVCTDMLEEGLFDAIFDVQGFDAAVSGSLLNNPKHIEINSDQYASPLNSGAMTNKIDVVALGALEVDVDFNVNVITSSTGDIMGASGGHSDTAAGARLSIVVAPSFRGRMPIIVDKVMTIVTPGESVDLVVTERGICVNPLRKDLEKQLKAAGLWIRDIKDLAKEVEGIVGKAATIEHTDKIVGLIEYRDGSIIDVIKQPKR